MKGTSDRTPLVVTLVHPFRILLRRLAQSGSASALGAEGRWFESSISDQLECVCKNTN